MKLRKLFVAVFALLSLGMVSAQEEQMHSPSSAALPPIPQDPNVRMGHLDNGLTYYIRHNGYQEGKADFHILMKNGSLQEEESQRGLAHMVEHLAFDNTEHFMDGALMKFIQGHGGYFNADTWFDHTNYYFVNMPTDNAGVIDSCMLVLKDWSNGIVLTNKAIDVQRDVIHNEYRLRLVGITKIFADATPTLFPNSQYGPSYPIGLMSVIDKCNPKEVHDYYNKWYRPDNQALIVVGDIDVDKIEAKIKELFSGIKVPANAPKVLPAPVPDTKDVICYVGKDKEIKNNLIFVDMKHAITPKEGKQSIEYLAQKYLLDVVSSMLNARFEEMAQDQNCPFMNVDILYGKYINNQFSKTEDAYELEIEPKPDKDMEAYTAVLTEVKRVLDHGFTATEYARAQDNYLSSWESRYTNRDKMKNAEFTSQYMSNFDTDEPIPSVEQKYQIIQMMVPQIPLEAVNQASKEFLSLKDSNFVILALFQEASGDEQNADGATYPTPQDFAAAKAKVNSTQVAAYVDNVKQEPLIAQAPKAGKVMKTTENKVLGYKELTLSNGAKVVLKKTDFKDNEIKMYAFAKGGYRAFPVTATVGLQMFDKISSECRLGNFTKSELKKAIAGKQVSLDMSVSGYESTLSGTSTPKDIETMMQLLYLKMTALSKDEKNLESFRQQAEAIFGNMDKEPETVYRDSVQKVIFCNDKGLRNPTHEDAKNLNFDEILTDAKALYGNSKAFTFIFCGNFDEATLLPLINTYIASLPNNNKTFTMKSYPVFTSTPTNTFTKAMANPNSHDYQQWTSNVTTPTLRNNLLVGIASNTLFNNYFRIIREKLSATYTPRAYPSIEKTVDGKVRYSIIANNMLNPDKVDIALPAILDGLKELSTNPNTEDFNKAKGTYLNYFDTNKKNNSFWIDCIHTYLTHGVNTMTDYVKTATAIQPKDVADFVTNVILKAGNHAEILMKAEKE